MNVKINAGMDQIEKIMKTKEEAKKRIKEIESNTIRAIALKLLKENNLDGLTYFVIGAIILEQQQENAF
jgi:hypothetical protein